MDKITVSLIKADVGGFSGHSTVRPELKEKAKECMDAAKKEGLLVDYHVLKPGDDLWLRISHSKGVDLEEIHRLAWKIFKEATEVAKKTKLHDTRQNLLSNEFDLLKNELSRTQEEMRMLALILAERDKFWSERVVYLSIIVGLIATFAIYVT